MTWCEHCRGHFPGDHYESGYLGAHRSGLEFGPYGELLAERDRYREALKPFAEKANWHHNYDGTGLIFKNGFYEREQREAIEAAHAALCTEPAKAGDSHEERS